MSNSQLGYPVISVIIIVISSLYLFVVEGQLNSIAFSLLLVFGLILCMLIFPIVYWYHERVRRKKTVRKLGLHDERDT